MSKNNSISEPITLQKQVFCEVWVDTQDIRLAMEKSKIPIPLARDMIVYGEELLRKPKISNYILMLTSGDSNDMEQCIKRLEVIRRQSWRNGDLKTVKDVEMQIASLRGGLIERSEGKSMNLNVGASDMSTQQLMAILSSVQGQDALRKQGLALVDGRVKKTQ